MQQAYISFCENPSHLQELSSFQFIETCLCRKVPLEQVPFVLLDMLHAHRYIPKVIVYHVGESDFGTTPQHLICHKACQFAMTCRALIRAANPFRQGHLGQLLSLMPPHPWYLGWNTQQAARKARAKLNGALAQAAMLAVLYVIPHPELSPEDHAAFIKQGSHDYSMTGNLLLMMDMQQAIQQGITMSTMFTGGLLLNHQSNSHK